MSKRAKKLKTCNKQIEKTYNFDVFKDYKCDGQYKMELDGDNIKIVEEQKEKQ